MLGVNQHVHLYQTLSSMPPSFMPPHPKQVNYFEWLTMVKTCPLSLQARPSLLHAPTTRLAFPLLGCRCGLEREVKTPSLEIKSVVVISCAFFCTICLRAYFFVCLQVSLLETSKEGCKGKIYYQSLNWCKISCFMLFSFVGYISIKIVHVEHLCLQRW